MCHPQRRESVSMMTNGCGCDCTCPVHLSIDDEIRMLEDHRRLMQNQIEAIDKKMKALKSVQPG